MAVELKIESLKIKQLLLMTVSDMEETCRRAKEYAERIDRPEMDIADLAFLVTNVHHEFVWAWANASGNLEQAVREITRPAIAAYIEGQNGGE